MTESRPVLHMNETNVKRGDLVTLTCSITYHSQLKVTLTLTEASRTINSSLPSQTLEDTCTASATIRAMKSRFGPFQCLAVFTQPNNTNNALAQNSIELRSNELEATHPACTFLNFQLYDVSTKPLLQVLWRVALN